MMAKGELIKFLVVFQIQEGPLIVGGVLIIKQCHVIFYCYCLYKYIKYINYSHSMWGNDLLGGGLRALSGAQRWSLKPSLID